MAGEHDREDLYKRLGTVEADLAKQSAVLETVVGALSDIKRELAGARQPWPAVLSAGAAGVGVVLLIVSQWTGTLRELGMQNAKAVEHISEIVREHHLDGHPRRVEQRVSGLAAS